VIGRTSIIAVLPVLAAALIFAMPVAASDGATVSVTQAADGKWHIDVSVTFTATGAGLYQANEGIGTVRVTLPGITAGTFSQPAAEPSSYQCDVAPGADGTVGTGFACTGVGESRGVTSVLFPTHVDVHIVTPVCYTFPSEDVVPHALADVWAAADVPDHPTDASYNLTAPTACPAAAPVTAPPAQATPAPTCTIPNLKNQSLAAATRKLTAAGCKRGAVKRVFSTRVRKGRVVRQSPAAAKSVPKGTKVVLTVSKGKRP
jgi:hypothetical protein